MPTKSPLEFLGLLLGVILSTGGVIAWVVKPFTKLNQHDNALQQLRNDFAHLSGKVEAIDQSMTQISSQLVALNTKMDLILKDKKIT